jgi:hypothetical protein
MLGSATAMKHPADGNSLHTDNAMTDTAVHQIPAKNSSLLVMAGRRPGRHEDDQYGA